MRTETEEVEPEREPVRFDINLEGATPEIVEVVQNIKKVAEKILYHWKTFPIVLPPPIAVVQDGDNPARKKPINMRDLFITPSFDELDTVAMDSKGDPRKLNAKQLQSVRENGEFEVESLNFPGQVHQWRLSQLLQKGTRRAHETLLNDTALAIRFIIVTAKTRIHSHFFSISQSLNALYQGFLQFIDFLIGMPSLCARDLEAKIKEERCKYLVAEMVVRPNLEEDLDNLCLFIKHQIRKQQTEKYRIDQESAPPVPYLFQTPKGVEIDLRLFNKEVMKKSLPVLACILEREAKGWFLQFREKTIADLKLKKLADEEIERQANIAIMDEYLRRVYGAVLSHPDILSLGPGIGHLLVDHAQSVILMHRAVENVQIKLNNTITQLKKHLQEKCPILSRIGPWLREKLRAAEEHFSIDKMWSAHEEALLLCRENNLDQTSYFLQRDLAFMKEREPILLQELSRVKIPTRVFYWRVQIWCPRNWVITRVHQGVSEVVPTVVSKMSITSTARSDPNEHLVLLNRTDAFHSEEFHHVPNNQNAEKLQQPRYLVEKQVTRTTSTRWPFWRWINYIYRTFSWLCNAMFIFGVVIPWCSPVSLRSLLSIEPFMPDLEPGSDGTLIPRKSSLTQTLCSRLVKLWRHISKSRTEFESRPDTGFIGKGFSRHLNRLWNYVLKGICGTLAIVLFFPIVCLIVSGFSIAIAISAPVWVPIVTFLFHLVCILIYDFDGPDPSQNKWLLIMEMLIWRILIQGCLQPISALFVICIICPLSSLAVFAVAIARRSCRMIWDTLMFHAVIKKRGRVPASDSFVAKRVAGPGLASNYFYQIRPEQALAAFEAKMEMEELNAYKDEMEHTIQEPQLQYSNFVEKCFLPFSAALVDQGVYKQIEKEALDISSALKEKVDKRKRELQTCLNITARSKIKLTSRELKLTIKQAAIMLEKFYPSHVLRRLPITEEEFWEVKGLPFSDWPGLAGLMFSEIFSQEFLTPLEDTDTHFKLEIRHLNLQRYAEMLRTAEYRDDLDVVSTVHTPKGNVQVHSPYLDVTTFNPTWKKNVTTHKTTERRRFASPWKQERPKYSAEKLLIPLPIPHPALITVIIYNRENEDPIPLESEQCQAILQALEDMAGSEHRYVSIDLTPPDSQSLASQPDDEIGAGDLRRHSLSLGPEGGNIGMGILDDCSSSRLSTSTNRNSGSVTINLASSEDITLEPDGERVTYSHSSYSTTV